MRISTPINADRYHIYVGLSNGKTMQQFFETEKYIKLVDYICRNNGISYTLSPVKGGYFSDSGSFVHENCLDLLLINAKKETVDEMAGELCAMLEQECVMITHDITEQYYVSDSIEKQESI